MDPIPLNDYQREASRRTPFLFSICLLVIERWGDYLFWEISG